MSDVEQLRNWKGSASDLTELLREWVPLLGLSAKPPSVRTVRYWRSIGIIGHSEGRTFAEREALEAILTLALRANGSDLAQIQTNLRRQDVDGLRDLLASAQSSLGRVILNKSRHEARGLERARTAVVLLAQGVIGQYNSLQEEGKIVHQDDEVAGDMQDAMSLLGRLYIEQGTEDRAACLHDVIDRCRFPLNDREWGLEAFENESFPYFGSRLIESDLRVPTPECYEIANGSNGRGLDDVVENQLHNELRRALESSGVEIASSYTAVRQFIGRRSLTTLDELYGYFEQEELPGRLSRLLVERFYEDVPETWLIEGYANRCANCGTLLRPHSNIAEYPEGRCPLNACRSVNRQQTSERLPLEGTVVCRPQILSYWVNPAIDELRVYDAAHARGVPSILYPEGDRCDVSLGDEIGVDVKAYESPVSLAIRLNRAGIGGLADYAKRILAIPDFIAVRRSYIDTLKNALETSDARSLEVLKVSEVLSLIEDLARARNT